MRVLRGVVRALPRVLKVLLLSSVHISTHQYNSLEDIDGEILPEPRAGHCQGKVGCSQNSTGHVGPEVDKDRNDGTVACCLQTHQYTSVQFIRLLALLESFESFEF